MFTAGLHKHHHHTGPEAVPTLLHYSQQQQSRVDNCRSFHHKHHHHHRPIQVNTTLPPQKFFIFPCLNLSNLFVMPMRNVMSAHALVPVSLPPPPLPPSLSTTAHQHKSNKLKRVSTESSTTTTRATNTITSSTSSNSLLAALLDCVVKFLRGIAYSTWATPPLITPENLHSSQRQLQPQRKYLNVNTSFESEQEQPLDHLNMKRSMESFTTTTTRLLTVHMLLAENRMLLDAAPLLKAAAAPRPQLATQEKMETLTLETVKVANDALVIPNTSSDLPDPIYIYSRPTFCYFVVDCHPLAVETTTTTASHIFENSLQETSRQVVNEKEGNIIECLTYVQSRLPNKSLESSCPLARFSTRWTTTSHTEYDVDDEDEVDDCDDGSHDNDGNNNSYHWCDTATAQGRQRYLSDCSDDFIFFAEDDAEENDDACINQLQLEEEDDDNDDDDDDEEDEEEVNKSFTDLKKVRFNLKPMVHIMRTWDFAYRSARKGKWEDYARDRTRFRRRIESTAEYLDPVLSSEHRSKIFTNRFADQT